MPGAKPRSPQSEENLYKRGETWWFRATVNGSEIRESLRTGNVKIARDLRGKKLKEIEQVRAGISVTKWPEAVVLWSDHILDQVAAKTAKRYAVSLKQCEPWLIDLELSKITGQVLGRMTKERKAAGATSATIRRDLTAISQVLTHAESQGLCEGNPTLSFRRTLKERRNPIELPEIESIELVVKNASPRFGKLIRAAELTGARQDELVNARWKDLDEKKRTLRIMQGKGNKTRTISLSGRALAHIVGTPQVLDSNLIFCSEEGTAWANPSSNFSQLCRALEKTYKTFKRFRFHDLRHLYAVRSLAQGMDIWTLSRQLGHSSVKVTESVYLSFLTPEQADAARQPPAQNSAQLKRFGENLEAQGDA